MINCAYFMNSLIFFIFIVYLILPEQRIVFRENNIVV